MSSGYWFFLSLALGYFFLCKVFCCFNCESSCIFWYIYFYFSGNFYFSSTSSLTKKQKNFMKANCCYISNTCPLKEEIDKCTHTHTHIKLPVVSHSTENQCLHFEKTSLHVIFWLLHHLMVNWISSVLIPPSPWPTPLVATILRKESW